MASKEIATRRSKSRVKLQDLDIVPAPSAEEDHSAEEHEKRFRERQAVQFQRLKDEAKALYGMVEGRPGVISARHWEQILEKAGDYVGNGRFIVRCLGAERYLDAETVAVLITFRQNLIADLEKPTAADLMLIDTAVVAYYNFLRVQGWIGNSALVFEGELFGKEPLNEIHGSTVGDRLHDQIERLAEVMMPLQDRAHRMLVRSLAQLPRPSSPGPSSDRPRIPRRTAPGP